MSNRKAYLMTQEEYLAEVVPVLKAFKDFLKKNNVFAYLSYGGYTLYSYRELVQVMNEKRRVSGAVWFDFSKPSYHKTPEEQLDYEWKRQSAEHNLKEATEEQIETKNKFISQLTDFYGERFVETNLSNPDNMKSNKRVIKFAIDYDIYKNLLESEEVDINDLKKYAESAGVRLPKKLQDDSVNRREDLYNKIYESMPSMNKEILAKLVEDIKQEFKPMEEIIYEKEVTRFTALIEDYSHRSEPIYVGKLAMDIPFEAKIFQAKEKKTEYNKAIHENMTYYIGLILLDGWEEVMHKYVTNFVAALKAQLVYAIIQNFSKITAVISSYELSGLKVGRLGFEAMLSFKFANGSYLAFQARAISAGGHTIQVYHFRYITDFIVAILADGTRFENPPLHKVIEHFSDAAASEKLFNPYSRIEAATTLKEVGEALYAWAKSKASFNNVRFNDGKDDVSVQFKDRYSNNYGLSGIYLKKDPNVTLQMNKDKAIALLEKYKAERPKMESGGQLAADPIMTMAIEQGVTTEYIKNKLAQRKHIDLPKELKDGGEIGKEEYVAIWSKPTHTPYWVIERVHSLDYARLLLSTSDYGEETSIDGRIYAYFKEGVNPNEEPDNQPPPQLSSDEKIIVRAVYSSEIDGQKGVLEYLGRTHSGEYAEYNGHSVASAKKGVDKKIEELEDDIKYLAKNGYPYDITDESRGKSFLQKLNHVARTKRGRELFSDETTNGAHYYEVYMQLYDKLENYFTDKFGVDAVFEDGGQVTSPTVFYVSEGNSATFIPKFSKKVVTEIQAHKGGYVLDVTGENGRTANDFKYYETAKQAHSASLTRDNENFRIWKFYFHNGKAIITYGEFSVFGDYSGTEDDMYDKNDGYRLRQSIRDEAIAQMEKELALHLKEVVRKEDGGQIMAKGGQVPMSDANGFKYEIIRETEKAVLANVPYWEQTSDDVKKNKQLFYEMWIPKYVLAKDLFSIKHFVVNERNAKRITNAYQKGTPMPFSWNTMGQIAPEKQRTERIVIDIEKVEEMRMALMQKHGVKSYDKGFFNSPEHNITDEIYNEAKILRNPENYFDNPLVPKEKLIEYKNVESKEVGGTIDAISPDSIIEGFTYEDGRGIVYRVVKVIGDDVFVVDNNSTATKPIRNIETKQSILSEIEFAKKTKPEREASEANYQKQVSEQEAADIAYRNDHGFTKDMPAIQAGRALDFLNKKIRMTDYGELTIKDAIEKLVESGHFIVTHDGRRYIGYSDNTFFGHSKAFTSKIALDYFEFIKNMKFKGGPVPDSIGGEAKFLSPADIAKKHGVPLSEISHQLSLGTKHELEHTDSEAIAYVIAKDHVYENPKYYTLLNKMEHDNKENGGQVDGLIAIGRKFHSNSSGQDFVITDIKIDEKSGQKWITTDAVDESKRTLGTKEVESEEEFRKYLRRDAYTPIGWSELLMRQAEGRINRNGQSPAVVVMLDEDAPYKAGGSIVRTPKNKDISTHRDGGNYMIRNADGTFNSITVMPQLRPDEFGVKVILKRKQEDGLEVLTMKEIKYYPMDMLPAFMLDLQNRGGQVLGADHGK